MEIRIYINPIDRRFSTRYLATLLPFLAKDGYDVIWSVLSVVSLQSLPQSSLHGALHSLCQSGIYKGLVSQIIFLATLGDLCIGVVWCYECVAGQFLNVSNVVHVLMLGKGIILSLKTEACTIIKYPIKIPFPPNIVMPVI